MRISDWSSDVCSSDLIKDMEDRANQQRMAGLFPVVALLGAAFGIDQHLGDVLNVADFPLALPDLAQRIIGRSGGIGRNGRPTAAMQHGRRSCWGRVCQYGWYSWVAIHFKQI